MKIELGMSCEEKNPYMIKNWQPQGKLLTTIYEHNDSVSCLQSLSNSQFFASGSYDGTIKIFDLAAIENEYLSSNSLVTINYRDANQPNTKQTKIKVLSNFSGTSSLLVGTNTGNIELFDIQQLSDKRAQKPIIKYQFSSEITSIQTLEGDRQNLFTFTTDKGIVGLIDIRMSTPVQKMYIGCERGIITSMKMLNNEKIGCISTLNGYLLLYDLRYNFISHIFKLINEQQKQILSMEQFNPVSTIFPEVHSSELLAMSYGSQKNEIVMFNVLQEKQYISPDIYLYSSKAENSIPTIPYLQNVTDDEKYVMHHYKFSDIQYYANLSYTSKIDQEVLSYLNDLILPKQDRTKEHWLRDSQACYSQICSLYQPNNSINKMLFLPSMKGLKQSSYDQKQLSNILLTAGNDKNVRFYNFPQDEIKKDSNVKTVKNCFINNIANKSCYCKQKLTGGIYLINEFERENYSNVNEQTQQNDVINQHKDNILDILFVELNDNENTKQKAEKKKLVVSASRDKTIKIWQ